jgi:predicted ATP-binding protein involved in virulence
MHLEKIDIKNFRVLKNIEISFQTPNDVEKNNVVNVIAGVNGCGKTSLLDAIFDGITNPFVITDPFLKTFDSIKLSGMEDINAANWLPLDGKIKELTKKNSNRHSPYDDPRIIYLPSQQSFNYSAISQLIVKYVFSQKIDTSAILGKAEFYIKEYVLNHERESHISEPEARTKNAVDSFNANFLDAKLLTQLVDLSKEWFNRPIFNNAAGEKVTIDQLSDGEKQLYARVIALMMLEPRNSIILIDEPEIALHPAWQQKIMQIYSHIGENNQFIVATHSAQVISSVPYKNLILLHKKNGQIQPVHLSEPPSGIDVNSILCEIMGAEPVPQEIIKLHNEYRLFVETEGEKTEQAQEIKKKILAQENERSAFMQEMEFLIELRDSE